MGLLQDWLQRLKEKRVMEKIQAEEESPAEENNINFIREKWRFFLEK